MGHQAGTGDGTTATHENGGQQQEQRTATAPPPPPTPPVPAGAAAGGSGTETRSGTGDAPGGRTVDLRGMDPEDDDLLNSGDRFVIDNDSLKKRLDRARQRERQALEARYQAERDRERAEREAQERTAQEERQRQNQEFEALANTRGARVTELEAALADRDQRIEGYKPYEEMIASIADKELRRLPDSVRTAVKPLLEGLSPLKRVEWLRDNVDRLAPAQPSPTEGEQPAAGTTATNGTAATTTNTSTSTNGTAPPPPPQTTQTQPVPPTPQNVGTEAFRGLSADEVERGRQDFGRELRRTW